jgi:hypothetical protein
VVVHHDIAWPFDLHERLVAELLQGAESQFDAVTRQLRPGGSRCSKRATTARVVPAEDRQGSAQPVDVVTSTGGGGG